MCLVKYRWNVKGFNVKNKVHQDLIIEFMELTHRVEIKDESKAVNL